MSYELERLEQNKKNDLIGPTLRISYPWYAYILMGPLKAALHIEDMLRKIDEREKYNALLEAGKYDKAFRYLSDPLGDIHLTLPKDESKRLRWLRGLSEAGRRILNAQGEQSLEVEIDREYGPDSGLKDLIKGAMEDFLKRIDRELSKYKD